MNKEEVNTDMDEFDHDHFRRWQPRSKPGQEVPECSGSGCRTWPKWQGPHHIWHKRSPGILGGYCDDHRNLIP